MSWLDYLNPVKDFQALGSAGGRLANKFQSWMPNWMPTWAAQQLAGGLAAPFGGGVPTVTEYYAQREKGQSSAYARSVAAGDAGRGLAVLAAIYGGAAIEGAMAGGGATAGAGAGIGTGALDATGAATAGGVTDAAALGSGSGLLSGGTFSGALGESAAIPTFSSGAGLGATDAFAGLGLAQGAGSVAGDIAAALPAGFSAGAEFAAPATEGLLSGGTFSGALGESAAAPTLGGAAADAAGTGFSDVIPGASTTTTAGAATPVNTAGVVNASAAPTSGSVAAGGTTAPTSGASNLFGQSLKFMKDNPILTIFGAQALKSIVGSSSMARNQSPGYYGADRYGSGGMYNPASWYKHN